MTTGQKPEQKGEEAATVKVKYFRLGSVPRTTVCRKHFCPGEM